MLLIIIFGPLVGGGVLDLLGVWVRWWRWWYVPLVAILPGVGLGISDAVLGGHLMGLESWPALIIFYGLFLVLVPVVMACVGVGIRRALASIRD